jgi:hypothetical protein
LKKRLTSLSQPSRKRGRPKDIADSDLLSARDDLYFILEQRCALVGWELQQACTVADVRAALEPLMTFGYRRLEIFKREHKTKRMTSAKLRSARLAIGDVHFKWRSAHEKLEASRQSAEHAREALKQAKSTPDEYEISTLCEQCERELAEATAKQRECDLRLDALRDDLKLQEAHFAPSELLKFILSERGRLNPLNFANAMAGLPFIGWRQSHKRCKDHKPESSAGIVYQRFLIVDKVVAQPAASAEEVVQKMRAHLLDKATHKDFAYEELREYWHHLKCAIESVYAKRLQPGALPYRIFAEYQRRTGARSARDIFLEEKNRL